MATEEKDRSSPTGELSDEERYELTLLNQRLTMAYNRIRETPYDPTKLTWPTKVFVPAKEKDK